MQTIVFAVRYGCVGSTGDLAIVTIAAKMTEV